jgi:hypothetical protein
MESETKAKKAHHENRQKESLDPVKIALLFIIGQPSTLKITNRKQA